MVGARRRRLGMGAVAALVVGIASKYYRGPEWRFIDGHALDFFGTLGAMLGAASAFPRASRWRVIGIPLGIVVVLELLQLSHAAPLDAFRATWLGAHVLGAAGSSLDTGDLAAYGLAALVALGCIGPRP